MKTIKSIILALIVLLYSSCDKGDDNSTKDDDPPVTSFKLDFTDHTNQDQMGDFAENAMVEFHDKVWSYGGVNSYGAADGHFGWSSDNGVNWVSLAMEPTLLTDYRIGHTVTLFNDELWLIGGEDSGGVWQEDIWKSADGIHWTSVPAPDPGFNAIAFHSTIVFQNRMYVIAPDLANDTVVVWSTADGVDWRVDNTSAFPLRGGHETVVFNDALYVIGGQNPTTFVPDPIWRSTNGTDWSPVTPTSTFFSSRTWHTATIYNGKVWVVAGEDAATPYKNDIWYSDDMLNWSQYDDGLLGSDGDGLNRHSTLLYRDELYVFGGYKPIGTSGRIFSFKIH